MRRDLSHFLIGGDIRFICENINDFQENEKRIFPFGSKVVFEGQYFVSYDFVAKLKEIRWEIPELREYWVYNCINGLMKHFRGSELEIEVNPLLHLFSDIQTNNVSDVNIFYPVFSYRPKQILRLENYESVPRKPKYEEKHEGRLCLVPSFGV